MSKLRLFNAIAASMLIAGIVLVALALATVSALDRRVIEAAAARNRHAEFLLAASFVGRDITRAEDLRNGVRMRPILETIQHLRPGIRSLEIIEVISEASDSDSMSGGNPPSSTLSEKEIQELQANRVMSHFDTSGEDRAWVFTVPIMAQGVVVGALRGRFSVSKYDQLIVSQAEVAKQVAVGAVVITSLTMLLLIRLQLHRPLARLLGTMDQVRLGNLTHEAAIRGPLEIRRLAENFNQMMAQLQAAMSEKERLVQEIRSLNDNLETRIVTAISELEREQEKTAAAQLVAQRNSNLAALGEVSAIMAHELGNPLNAIYGRLQLMKKTPMPEETVRHWELIKKQVTRMSEVIQHILKSTRVENDSVPVQINEVITDVLTLTQVPGVNVTTRLQPNLPPVAAGKTSVHGVIENLVTNAVQAMHHEGDLTVSTELTEQSDLEGHVLVQAVESRRTMVRLRIQDAGPGIPLGLLDKLCEPFFTTRHGQGGTGLGLAICRRVVAAAGGRLAVSSVQGKGTTFTVDFPVWMDKG